MKLFLLALAFVANAEKMPQNALQNPGTQEHIRMLIQNLPLDSKVRHELESGNYGDGVHYSWMDAMRRAKVKRAKVITVFDVSFWQRRPKQIKVIGMLYFDKYDTDCAQITDADRLHAIQTSGLQQELEKFAIRQTEKTPWHVIDGGIGHPKRGSNHVEVFDDERVPHRSTFLIPSTSLPSELNDAILKGDEMRVNEILKTGSVHSAELDQALLLVSNVVDDSCLIKALLKAGANPNARTSQREPLARRGR